MSTRPDLEALIQLRAAVYESTQAAATRREYARDWKHFYDWCDAASRTPFPAAADTVILYLMDCLRRSHRVTSITRYASAILDYHRSAGIDGPDRLKLRAFLSGARRLRAGLEQPLAKHPFTIESLRLALPLLGTTPIEIRNRALLTLGWASALRRGNLVALNWPADVRRVPAGVVLVIRRGKTDQEGQGSLVGVAAGQHPETCPVRALEEWLKVRGIEPGPLFQSYIRNGKRLSGRRMRGATVCRIVKASAQAIGRQARDFGAHSLRSGFVTTAVQAGVSEFVIASQTLHRSLSSLRRYYRVSDPLRVNASAMVGL